MFDKGFEVRALLSMPHSSKSGSASSNLDGQIPSSSFNNNNNDKQSFPWTWTSGQTCQQTDASEGTAQTFSHD